MDIEGITTFYLCYSCLTGLLSVASIYAHFILQAMSKNEFLWKVFAKENVNRFHIITIQKLLSQSAAL